MCLLKGTPVCRLKKTTSRTLFTGIESKLILNAKRFTKTSGHVFTVNWKGGTKWPKIWFRLYANPRIEKIHRHPVDNIFSVQATNVANQLPHLLQSETTTIKTINKNYIAKIFW
jgi:hypothetical protein